MKTNFKVVKPTDELNKVYNLIYSEKNTFIPVVNDHKLFGAIDATNLNEYIFLQSKLAKLA
jgi:predicted transcriptional regulator